jgi:hypothetical protein
VAWGRWIGDLYGSGFDTTQTYVFVGSRGSDGASELTGLSDDHTKDVAKINSTVSESKSNAIRVIGRGNQLDNSASNEASSSQSRDVHAGIAREGEIRPEHAHIVSVKLKFEGHVRLLVKTETHLRRSYLGG